MDFDYKTLTMSFALMFAGSILGPFILILMAFLVLGYKNQDLILSQSPKAKNMVDEMKKKIKPYLEFIILYYKSYIQKSNSKD